MELITWGLPQWLLVPTLYILLLLLIWKVGDYNILIKKNVNKIFNSKIANQGHFPDEFFPFLV